MSDIRRSGRHRPTQEHQALREEDLETGQDSPQETSPQESPDQVEQGRRPTAMGHEASTTAISALSSPQGLSATAARPTGEHHLHLPFSSDLYADPTAHRLAHSYANLVDFLGEEVEEALGLNKSFLGRLGLIGVEGSLIAWCALANHEAGHVHAAHRQGKKSWIEELNLTSGLSVAEGPFIPEESYAFSAGGINRSELTTLELFKDNMRHGHRNLGEALQLMISNLDDTRYINKTARLEAKYGAVLSSDDIGSLKYNLGKLGVEVSYRHMLAQSLVAEIFSPARWEAVKNGVEYLRKGERHFDLETWRIGNLEGYMPHVALLRSIKGDTFRINTTLNPRSELPIALELDIRTDVNDWDVNALGAALEFSNGLNISDTLIFSPYLEFGAPVKDNTLGAPENPLLGMGSRFRLNFSDRCRVVGDIGYGKFADGQLRGELRGSAALVWDI